MPVTITLIVVVITALAAIKALIASIHRLYDDTPLDFRALHLGTLELEWKYPVSRWNRRLSKQNFAQ